MRDYHMHLERGPLDLDRLRLFLDRAAVVGVTEIGVTEHLYRFREARGILWNDRIASRCVQTLEQYAALAEAARGLGLPVKFGLEADYVPGKEAETKRVLALFPLDYVIGSVHWLGDWGFDLSAESWAGRSVNDAYRLYYRTLGQAAESGLFDIIGHPGNIAYHGHYADPGLMADLEDEFLDLAASLPVALEFNAGGLLRPAKATFPRPAFGERIIARGCALTTGSDAHYPEHVGHEFVRLYAELSQHGVRRLRTFTERRPDWFSIEPAPGESNPREA